VNPGDVIVADGAGVVVIPQEIASNLLKRLRNQKISQAAYLASVKRGDFSNAWVDRILLEAGCSVTHANEEVAA
jgi:regulator of RNase E activity RraA